MAIRKGRAMRNLSRMQQLVYREGQRRAGQSLWYTWDRAKRRKAHLAWLEERDKIARRFREDRRAEREAQIFDDDDDFLL